jgi:methionine synthase I (cobalamin-dependent)
MAKIIDKIKQGKVLVSDGAWGTFLQQKGLKIGECPEEWNLTYPDEVLDIARSYIEAGSDMIGANCGNGIAGMVGIVKEIRKTNPDIPILIHANAGMPVYQDSETVFPETPDEMAAIVPKIIAAGANVIGGCCGTTPEHITEIRKTVDET